MFKKAEKIFDLRTRIKAEVTNGWYDANGKKDALAIRHVSHEIDYGKESRVDLEGPRGDVASTGIYWQIKSMKDIIKRKSFQDRRMEIFRKNKASQKMENAWRKEPFVRKFNR